MNNFYLKTLLRGRKVNRRQRQIQNLKDEITSKEELKKKTTNKKPEKIRLNKKVNRQENGTWTRKLAKSCRKVKEKPQDKLP